MRNVVRAVLAAVTLALAAAPAGAQQASTDAVPVKKYPSAEAAPPKKALESPDPMPRRGFNVVLLLGDMQGADAQDSIPVAARKALSDMKDFLPYKSYRLLDTQWIIGGTSGPALTRLRGAEEQEYELELRASPLLTPGTAALDPRAISVRFVLRDGDVAGAATKLDQQRGIEQQNQKDMAAALFRAETGREIYQLEQERDDLTLQVNRGRQNVEVGMANPDDVKRLTTRLESVNRRINDLKRTQDTKVEKAGGRPVIDTSFKMDDGETVVVGTSRVKGGSKALIALLTATSDRPKASAK
jgi:hypothetical protein